MGHTNTAHPHQYKVRLHLNNSDLGKAVVSSLQTAEAMSEVTTLQLLVPTFLLRLACPLPRR